MKKIKTGRNKHCPCGSGKKYKQCCGSLSAPTLPFSVEKQIQQKCREREALQVQRKQQQGLGKPIISTTSNGSRIVCVNNKLFSSKKWKTFHDFLSDYIKQLLGEDWYKGESLKTYGVQHSLLKVYNLVCGRRIELAQKKNDKGIYEGHMTGAVSFYYWLAYNLYLIEHNKDIQNRLIKRLKHNDQFASACYEIFVIAIFLRAGYSIEFEDEDSRKSTHCEFIATHQASGKKYGVEVKQRNLKSIISDSGSDKTELGYKPIGNLLKDALKKDTNYERIIFIDINLPSSVLKTYDSNEELEKALVNFIKAKEKHFETKPPAYVFLTNYPYHHEQDLESTEHYIVALSDGFKINNFGFRETTLRQAIISREQHKPIVDLFEAIKRYSNVPSTFDGSIPEFTYGESLGRLKIGDIYTVPDKTGNPVDGVLVDCVVNLQTKKASGLCKTDNDILLISFVLTDAEINAYQQHPDTFFGIYKKEPEKAKTPLDLYDFFYRAYSELSKEVILSRMQPHSNRSDLQALSREKLLSIYCEGLVNSCWHPNKEN